MEQSPLGSTSSEAEQINSPDGAPAPSTEHDDTSDQRQAADRLLAALASGNLDHLAQAREAFLGHPPAEGKKEPRPRCSEPPAESFSVPADLSASLEHRAGPRHVVEPVA